MAFGPGLSGSAGTRRNIHPLTPILIAQHQLPPSTTIHSILLGDATYTCIYTDNTHTHPFNGPLSRTTWVSRYQKGKTNLDFTEARDSEWQWHQLGYMQVCTSLQTGNQASTSPLKFFTGRMPFLLPNQQRQSTEGNYIYR